MSNTYRALQALLAPPPLQIGTVDSVTDGIATITMLGGGTVRARGQATAGDKVFVRGDVIEGPAPNLTVVVYEV